MKKTLFLILSLTTFSIYSQIEIDIKENIKTKAFNSSKSTEYDSIFDFTKQKRNIDYLKYVGQDLFLPPLTKKTKSVQVGPLSVLQLKTTTATKHIPDTVYVDKKLTRYRDYYEKKAREIESDLQKYKVKTNAFKPYISVIVENPYHSTNTQLSSEVFNKIYKIIDITNTKNEDLRSVPDELKKVRIWLKTETNDTIYFDKDLAFADKSLSPFLIKGFYEYHKKNYVGKKLFVYEEKEKNPYKKKKYIDINTGEEITLQIGEIWSCKELSFVNTSYSGTLSPFYILSKGNQSIKIKLGELIQSGLITLEQLEILYTRWLNEKEEKRKEREAYLAKIKKDCQQKYSKENCEKLLNGKIELGMTKSMILYAFGEPYGTFVALSNSGVKEIYSYGGTIIYFQNEKVIAIEQYY